jgi:hypothetical protein
VVLTTLRRYATGRPLPLLHGPAPRAETDS